MANQQLDLSENNGSSLVATAAVFLVLSWLSVGLRTYTRAFLMKSFQADDWFMLIAQLIFTASCAFILAGISQGMGRHNEAITDVDAEIRALMWQALATATYVLDMMFIKLSIGVFLLRLSVQKIYTWILWASLVVIFIWSIVIFFWDLFQCNPMAKQWDFRIVDGQCVSADQIVSAAYAISAMTIVSDWLYALLPIPMLWTVKMTKQAKTTVIVILGLGIFASIATLIRIKYLADLVETQDILYAGTDAMVWTLVEPGVAIIASSLATIRPLLRAMRIRGFESTGHYGTGLSVAGRSAGTRSKPNNMPGQDPNDVSLRNVEPKAEGGPILVVSSAGNDFEEQNKSLPSLPRTPKSEVYIIEGNKPSPTGPWRQSRGLDSPSESFEQIHDLEAQSQETRGFGLGDGRR